MNVNFSSPVYAALTDDGFRVEDIDNPEYKIFRLISCDRSKFNRYALFDISEEEPFKHGYSLWINAMQSHIVDLVYFTLDGDDIYTIGHFQNDLKFPFIFGRLQHNSFYDEALEALKS